MALFRNEILRSTRAIGAAWRPALIGVGLYLTAGLAALTGSGFLLASAYGVLGRALGAPVAGLILAAGLAALAAILVLSARLVKTENRSKPLVAADPATKAALPPAPDLATTAVFAAAFVLARRFPRIG